MIAHAISGMIGALLMVCLLAAGMTWLTWRPEAIMLASLPICGGFTCWHGWRT